MLVILSIETSLGSGSCTAQRRRSHIQLFNLDKNKINGMVFVDYKKAFDMVDHATLLSKLEAYNLDKNALFWFKSYSIGFIHGTVIVHWDRNSRCATGFHVGNPCFLLKYQ